MRLATIRDAEGTRLGVETGGQMINLVRAASLLHQPSPPELHDMLALIRNWDDAERRVRDLIHQAPAEARLDLDAIEIVAPIPRPTKNIFCLGRNYAEHAAESLRAAGQPVHLPPYP